jgi:phage/plasmid-associated DNA primase
MKTVKLPITYDRKAPTRPVLDILGRWVSPEDVPILIQILAQAIYQNMRRTTLKRNYLLQGETDAGKSTYIDLTTKFFGPTVIAGVSLQEICADIRFLAARLEGKLLNIYDDLKDIPLHGSGKLKYFDGRVTHEVERKGKTPYSGVITCPHVFICNQPPSYPEELTYDDAWWTRWEFVSFLFSHTKDSDFQNRTFTHAFMSGLLNLVIAELIKIQTAKRLVVNHTPEEVRERWGLLSNPLKMWVRDNFRKTNTDHDYDKKKLFEQYSKYVEDTETPMQKRIKTIEDFGRKLPLEGFVSIQVPIPGRPKKSNERMWIFRSKLQCQGKDLDVMPSDGQLQTA